MAFIGSVSGSHTKLTDGTSYLIAGSNVTIVTGSNGSVTISSTGGGASSTYIDSVSSGKMYATGSLALVSNSGLTSSPSDALLYVSGQFNGSTKSAVFGGDVVVSGTLIGAQFLQPFGIDDTVSIISTKRFAVGNGDFLPGLLPTDIAHYFTGTVGSKGTTTRGVTVISGDAVVSGTLYNAAGTAYTAGSSSPQYFTSPQSGQVATTGSLILWGPAGTLPSSVGSDVFAFVSGNNGIPQGGSTPSPSKVSLFHGDLAVSGAIRGVSSLGSGYGAVYTSDTHLFSNNAFNNISYQGQSDIGIMFGGTAGSKNTSTKGTAVFIGDVAVSGSFYHGATTSTGQDVFFYVSGTQGLAPNVAGRKAAVFGGDVLSSGTVRATKFEAGGSSTFVSSSNGSSLEIGASTQVLILSGGSASSLNPRNMLDTNFFVSGAIGSGGTTTRGNATFGGPVFVSGALVFGGDSAFPSAISSMFNLGQNAYWQASYPTNPAVYIAGKSNSILLALTLIASNNYVYGRTRIGSTTAGATAYLHITASNGAGYAPIKLDSGSLLASPEAGAIEYDATRLYLTDGNSSRKNILMSGDITGTFNDSSAALVTTASVSFAGAQGATYFASRSVGTISAGSDVFFYVSGTARAGHNPPNFVGKRALFNGDVVTSGTLQLVGAGNTLTIGSDTLLFVSGSPGSRGVSFSRGTSVFAGDLVVSGTTHIDTTVEVVGLTSSIGAGASRFDLSQQAIFYLSGTTSDFTANFINAPSGSAARAISVTLLVTQSSTAYRPTAVQIDGGAQNLLWANGVTPTANANKQDVFGFSLIRSGTNWVVLGQLSTYG